MKPVVEQPRGNGELILVVDDEAPMRLMTQQILETFGYRVILAGGGVEAVAIYSQRGGEIAAVITDMSMPVMEGPETIRILQSMNAKLPIVGGERTRLTTYAAKLADLGIKHILAKPYTAAELLKMLKRSLEGAPPEDVGRAGTGGADQARNP